MKMKMRGPLAAGLAVLFVAGTAAGATLREESGRSDTRATVAETRAADRAALSHALEGPSAARYFRPYDRLADLLPHVRHTSRRDPERREAVITDSVVRGSVVAVMEDRGFVEKSGSAKPGEPGAASVGFDDPAAHWRNLRVEVDVAETLSGPVQKQLYLDFPLIGSNQQGEEASAVGQALKDLGEVVVFSKANPSGPQYLGLTRMLPDKAFGLATVSERGDLGFPFAGIDGRSADLFLAGLDTIEELRTETRVASRVKEN